MRIGLMYFDNSHKTSFVEKCAGAIAYYTAKYNHAPTAITVHPSMMQNLVITTLDEPTVIVKNITFHTSKSVMKNHFWVGLENDKLQSEVSQNSNVKY